VYDAIVRLTLLIVSVRACLLVLRVVISPVTPRLRLVPLSSEHARSVGIALTFLVTLVPITWFVPPLIERFPNAANLASSVRLALGTIVAMTMLVVAVRTTSRRSLSGKDVRHGMLPKFSISLASTSLIIIIYGLWAFDFTTVALIVAVLSATVAIQIPMRSMVFYFWRDKVATTNLPGVEAIEGEQPAPVLAPSILLPTARLCVVLAGLAACAAAADLPILGAATSDSPMARFGVRLLEVAALALLANVLWIIIRTSVDHHLSGLLPALEHEPSSASRLLTLLPILRMTALVVIGVMLLLSSLWTLGLEITPLLAGAGVVGLAFGFGAQSLVKDVITGVFYLAEDTFRIGEYIESGSSTKGTVEKLTLRTVALRHHNGPLHFVPYGTLGTVRNTSRDWVVEKFNLPLPLEVDSERIRKLIKGIGELMLDDPDLGPLIIEPLKGKLYRIDPGVKIFRCSFRTAPGNQFEVRAAAYKRIEGALNEAGITFAGTQIAVAKPHGPDILA
jgi:small-conductance mechanosensitive channel